MSRLNQRWSMRFQIRISNVVAKQLRIIFDKIFYDGEAWNYNKYDFMRFKINFEYLYTSMVHVIQVGIEKSAF